MPFSTQWLTRSCGILFPCLGVHSGDVNGFGWLFWMCLFCQIGAFHADALKHLKAATGCHKMSFKWGKPIWGKPEHSQDERGKFGSASVFRYYDAMGPS